MGKKSYALLALIASCVPAFIVACIGDNPITDAGTDATTSDGAADVTTKDAPAEAAGDAAPEAAPPPPPCMASDDAGALDATADAYQTFGSKMYGCRGHIGWPARATLCAKGCVPCTASDWIAKSQGTAPTHQYWVDDALEYSGGGPPNDCFAVGGDGGAVGELCSDPQTPMRVCVDGPADGGSDAAPSYPYSSVDVDQNVCNWTGCGFLSDDAGFVPDASQDLHFGGCDDDLTAGTLCCCQ